MNVSNITKMISGVMTMVFAVLVLAIPADADFSNTLFLSFSGCEWKAEGGELGLGNHPYSRTVDLNEGCRYLDADVRYTEVGGTNVYTKWCQSVNAAGLTCSIATKVHDNSRSQAQSWETDHWQSSGWWL